jgi:hypothetical protein
MYQRHKPIDLIRSLFFILIIFLILKPEKYRVRGEAPNLSTRDCNNVLSVRGYLATLVSVVN